MASVEGRRIAVLATDGGKQVELTRPVDIPQFNAAIIALFAR